MKKYWTSILFLCCLCLLIPATASANTLTGAWVEPSTVTVSGSKGASAQATAYDITNNRINGGVIWSVSPDNSGVSISKQGKITVSANATPGAYIIFATPDSSKNTVWGDVQSAGLYVEFAPDTPELSKELDHITLAQSSVTLNASGGSAAHSARAYNSDNQEITGVTWAISPENGGVTIDESGVIRFDKDAVSGNYIVIATKGAITKTAPLTVVNNTGTPAIVLSRVVIAPSTVTIGNSTITSAAQAAAYDSDGKPITSGLLWSVNPPDLGVSMDNTGRITVFSGTMTRIYHITATPDSEAGTVSGNAQSADFTVQTAAVLPEKLDHVTLTQSVVTVDGTTAGTSSASALDKNNQDVNSVTWTVSPADSGVSINISGVISVAANTAAGKYVIRASKDGVTKEVTLTVVNNAKTMTFSASGVLRHHAAAKRRRRFDCHAGMHVHSAGRDGV